jgi:hypothetical protein
VCLATEFTEDTERQVGKIECFSLCELCVLCGFGKVKVKNRSDELTDRARVDGLGRPSYCIPLSLPANRDL